MLRDASDLGALKAARLVVCAALLGFLGFAAHLVTTFPTRISVVPNLQVDASTYDAIAWNLSQSWAVESIPPLQPPGFVAFLGIVYAIFGHSWIAGRLALWGCLVIATTLTGLLARSIYRRESAGWIASLLCASSPAMVAYAGTLQYELLAAVLILVLVWAVVHIADAPRKASARSVLAAATVGVGLGLAILTREVLVVLVPIAVAYLCVRISSIDSKARAAVIGAVCFISASIPPVAWSTIQSVRTERVVAISDKGPLVMAFGNNPAANGTFNTPLVGVPDPSGWAFIRANPQAAARLWLRKAAYFWGLLRDGWNVPRPSSVFVANATAGMVPLQWILPWARGGWLLGAFLIALAFWRRESWMVWWPVPAVVTAVMAVHVVTISSYRFALPVLPLLMAVVAGPLAGLLQSIWRSTGARIAAMLIVLLAIGAQRIPWPLVYELDATEFDGFSAENRSDDTTGQRLRFAEASRGRRVVLALVDEYFQAGTFTIRMNVRTGVGKADAHQPLFRVAVSTFDGSTICDQLVNSSQVSEQPDWIEISCTLEQGGPSTFLVETLGVVDLGFGPVQFAWNIAPVG